uniref:uncharacterized protein LOC122595363 n=1 Tax=Erigeron canadensis TaxID=72917 RepID=UPI001CB98EBC|nr:uncharacterized protein LOC122595363 [Erigeron canadensis]
MDTDPSLEAYFQQLQKPPKPVTFDPKLDRRFLQKAQPKPQLNATTLILGSFNTQMGFSGSISDNGIKISEVVQPGLNISFRSFKKKEKNESLKIPWVFFTVSFSTLAFEMIGYNFTRSWAHAIMFVVLVNHFLKIDRNQSLIMVIRKGVYLSFRRLIWFNTTRLGIMLVFTQILARLFFGDIKDRYTSYKYFVKLAFMPYSYELIWVENLENRIYGFLYSWYLLEMLVSWVFTVLASVVMAHRYNSDWEVIKDGFRLLSLRKRPAIFLKSFEYIVWGFVAAMLTAFLGELFASFIKSFVEVYFMVAWIIYYFAVKKMDENSRGVRFGYRTELQGMLADL